MNISRELKKCLNCLYLGEETDDISEYLTGQVALKTKQ